MSREARLSILLAALALPAAALAVTLDSWAWLAAQVALQAAAFALVLRHHFHAER